MANNLPLDQSCEMVYGVLNGLFESCMADDLTLEPNGVMFGLVRFFVDVLSVTGWEDKPDELFKEYYNGYMEYVKRESERHAGGGGQSGGHSSVPNSVETGNSSGNSSGDWVDQLFLN